MIPKEQSLVTIPKPVYRHLGIAEHDTLFAFYEKYRGNVSAMVRDKDCPFKGRGQLIYYERIYGFEDKFAQIRRETALKVLAKLKDSKILALQRAIELIETRQKPLLHKEGYAILDKDGEPIFYEISPDHVEIDMAWKIIKTELGEVTSITHQNSNLAVKASVVISTEEEKRIMDLFSPEVRKAEIIEIKDEIRSPQPVAADQSEADNQGGLGVPQIGEQGSAYEGD